jgi:hypothetical protein
LTGSDCESQYVGCGSTKDFDAFRVSGMPEEPVLATGDPEEDPGDGAAPVEVDG